VVYFVMKEDDKVDPKDLKVPHKIMDEIEKA
jgi:hypothetical protein